MLLDAALPIVPLNKVPEIARRSEDLGFDGLWLPETVHDPFLAGALVAEHTRRMIFGTGIAVAFARSPATIAYAAWDLANMSEGRFILGLGTQVKAHIERRFGMPWPESVVGKLREQIQAVRAFWATWQTGVPLKFHGEYYKLSLMSPFFNPGPMDHPTIPIYVAGVNTGLARLAGEVADGFLVHPLHTRLYLQEVLLPAIEGGAKHAGRSRQDVCLSASVFIVTGSNEEFFVRAQIAFYASTPSYRAVMTLHGWEETAVELSRLASLGDWGRMPALIDDEMLATFAIICDPSDLPVALRERYGGLVDRCNLYVHYIPGERDDFWMHVISGLK